MIDELLAPGAIRPAYQPIVDLERGEVVGFEALARFDPSSGFDGPAEAFASVAHDHDALTRLDRACLAAALRGALEGALCSEHALFLNWLPSTMQRDLDPELVELLRACARHLTVVAEVTEIGVTTRPAELLAFATTARRLGLGIAVDDVGVNPDSLALLPLLRPDVVKLDRSLLRARPTVETGQVLGAVLATTEASGAVVLCEGIEDEADVALAAGLGAAYGQGWHLGRPGPLSGRRARPGRPLPLLHARHDEIPETPFDLVAAGSGMQGRQAPYEYLLALSLDLEAKAAQLDGAVVASTFQEADRFTPATAVRYEQLAGRVSLVGAMAEGLPAEPAPGVRGAAITADDPLRHDWNVVVLSPHFAAALIARDRTHSGPVGERRYDYAVTHDRRLVTLAARSLLDRVLPD